MLKLIASHASDTSDWDSTSFGFLDSPDIDALEESLGRLTILIGPKINSNMSLQTAILGSTINSIKPKSGIKQ